MEKTKMILIANVVSSHYGIDKKTMFKRLREAEVVKARQVFHYLARKMNGESISLSEIGRYGRVYKVWDHCTVLHSIKSVQDQIDIYPEYKNNICLIIEKINELKEKEIKDILNIGETNKMIINNLKIMNHEKLSQHH